jgi:hypothetical protein
MPPRSGPPRNQLAAILVQRGWSVSRLRRNYQDTAIKLDLGSGYVAERTAKRWISGQASIPNAPSPAVLEAMFGVDVHTLFGPPLAPASPGDAAPTDAAPLVPAGGTGDDGQARPALAEEASPTDRRDLLSAGAVLTAAGLAGSPVERAARLSRAIDATTPDTLTLAQLENGIYQLSTLFDVTPLGDLVGAVERAWGDAETLLASCPSGSGHRDLERLAGWYAYYRGRLAFHMDDDDTALTFLVLAGHRAAASGDNLLSGAVAVHRCVAAFYARQLTTSATIARRALSGAHPYTRPVLASQVARASAQIGDADGALTALETMRDTLWTSGPQPGAAQGDEEAYEAFSAVTLGYLGRGDEAEAHGRRSLALLTESGRHLQVAGSHLALARAFIRRPRPEPEQAAGALSDALTAAEGNDHGHTANRAAGVYRHLAAKPDWAKLPAVRELGERLPARRALPPGATV